MEMNIFIFNLVSYVKTNIQIIYIYILVIVIIFFKMIFLIICHTFVTFFVTFLIPYVYKVLYHLLILFHFPWFYIIYNDFISLPVILYHLHWFYISLPVILYHLHWFYIIYIDFISFCDGDGMGREDKERRHFFFWWEVSRCDCGSRYVTARHTMWLSSQT